MDVDPELLDAQIDPKCLFKYLPCGWKQTRVILGLPDMEEFPDGKRRSARLAGHDAHPKRAMYAAAAFEQASIMDAAIVDAAIVDAAVELAGESDEMEFLNEVPAPQLADAKILYVVHAPQLAFVVIIKVKE